MIPDDVRISNFNLDTLIITDVAETNAVPLCDKREKKKKRNLLKLVINIL